MKIVQTTNLMTNRPLCTQSIRIAGGMKTHEAKRQAFKRGRLGIPVRQCGAKSDFTVDGEPRCRPHASQAALAYMIERND